MKVSVTARCFHPNSWDCGVSTWATIAIVANAILCFHPNSWDCGVSTLRRRQGGEVPVLNVSIPTRGIVVFLLFICIFGLAVIILLSFHPNSWDCGVSTLKSTRRREYQKVSVSIPTRGIVVFLPTGGSTAGWSQEKMAGFHPNSWDCGVSTLKGVYRHVWTS